ncbi:MAG: HAMP domain-containing histidine kinase, partial [Candidatus Scalindua sp.]|nr:HAMP domain-containing histidine kinase [Candidatus Scalindua sp.]
LRGTGLGMSIVKNLIKQYGGSIDVRSEIEKGTTVTISLPVEKQ